MRGSAIRTRDDRYIEFINDLQSLGELQNVIKLISQRSTINPSNADLISENTCPDLDKLEASTAMRALWENGSIELRESKRLSKGTLKRAYKLSIDLDKISHHFEKERIQKHIISRDDGPQETRSTS